MGGGSKGDAPRHGSWGLGCRRARDEGEADRVTVETVKTVGGLVIRPPGLHQQAVLGQYPKQPVPSDLEPAIILTLKQIMQLAGADPWLA